jgi:plastocyanin
MAIVNDDAAVIHHAYVDEDEMRYDSGDQPPGSRSVLTFDSQGRFRVLCGIHPRMRLDVEVR